MCSPALTNYLANLLVEFTHIDRLQAIRHAQGKQLDQIATRVAVLSDDPSSEPTERSRIVYRHIGDYTLFWAGVYPEQLRRTHRPNTDTLLDYVSQGKRSYAIVSELVRDEDVPPPSLFRHLSEEFEHCLYGLSLVRRGWERKRDALRESGGDLLY